MNKVLLLVFLLTLFISCNKNPVDKSIENHFNEFILSDGWKIESIKTDTITELHKDIQKSEDLLADLKKTEKYYIEKIEYNQYLIDNIPSAKIVKPNQIKLYAFKVETFGKENSYYQTSLKYLKPVTTKEKDIKIANDNIKEFRNSLKEHKNLIINQEKEVEVLKNLNSKEFPILYFSSIVKTSGINKSGKQTNTYTILIDTNYEIINVK